MNLKQKIEKALEDNSPSVTYKETVKEIIEMILEDINSYMEPIDFLTEDLELQEEIRDFLTDQNLEQALRNELTEGTKDMDQFFDQDQDIIETLEDQEEYEELPLLIGYIHVFKEE